MRNVHRPYDDGNDDDHDDDNNTSGMTYTCDARMEKKGVLNI